MPDKNDLFDSMRYAMTAPNISTNVEMSIMTAKEQIDRIQLLLSSGRIGKASAEKLIELILGPLIPTSGFPPVATKDDIDEAALEDAREQRLISISEKARQRFYEEMRRAKEPDADNAAAWGQTFETMARYTSLREPEPKPIKWPPSPYTPTKTFTTKLVDGKWYCDCPEFRSRNFGGTGVPYCIHTVSAMQGAMPPKPQPKPELPKAVEPSNGRAFDFDL